MPNQRIDQLNAETTPAASDVLPIYSISGSDTKKIRVDDLIEEGVNLIANASIPAAKVNLSGISGTNLTAGTVAASKLDTSTIPATGGVTVSNNNLQLVAPTSPIVRNAGTGSLEHATSGVTAGTYTKVTVDTKGHVTVGATLAGGDVPIATSAVIGGVSIPANGGLALTGGGALSHSNSVAGGASTRSGITYDDQGHITSTAALVAADLPVATNAVKGAVIAGTGLAVDGNGILSTDVATTNILGGIKIGSEFELNGSNQLLLATQANIAANTAYPKVTVNSKGIITAGASLVAGDIPNLNATIITAGTIDIARIGTNAITGEKLANYSVSKIGDTLPTADFIGQLFFNPISRDLFLWDGNVFQPIGISVGEIIFAGTFDASAGGGIGHVASVTAEGTAIGLVEGSPLPAAAAANNRYYLVVSEGGTITSGNAPNVALAPPDILLSTGIEWTEVDVSQTFTSVTAAQVQFTPAGAIAANNVQAAIEELDNEKLALTGGIVTGNLEIGTTGSLSFEGSTANAFETTLAVTDPTADRTITLPDQNGNVIVSGNASIVNADINANAAIAFSKLAGLTSSNILVGNSNNVATSVTVTGDVTISNTGVTSITADSIVNADINANAAIVDTKLATISTAGKVSNTATTATNANTASAIVARDANGNFSAGTITAALNGNASTVTTNANLTGDVTSTGNATSIAAGVIVNNHINASAAIAGTKIVAASTSVVGTVQLSDSTNTTSSILAATPTAVKAAYDLADAALPKTGGTITGNIVLDNQFDVRFREATANGTNYVGFQAPAAIGTDVLWTLPATDAAVAGHALVSNAAGVLSWAQAGGAVLIDGGNFANGSSIITTSNVFDGGDFN
jgi:hypothetical protein